MLLSFSSCSSFLSFSIPLCHFFIHVFILVSLQKVLQQSLSLSSLSFSSLFSVSCLSFTLFCLKPLSVFISFLSLFCIFSPCSMFFFIPLFSYYCVCLCYLYPSSQALHVKALHIWTGVKDKDLLVTAGSFLSPVFCS